ncbi:helix-turn-helix transcriptional regulator [Streptococcus halotolerans]|uniref:helix-turn-helix transcriptional regulator n=1 Tax=Streptococcus halotolerans TaxID=1814128 RepID=UPI0007883F84|nr:WYL domain-containing protein [Streptococcus halotolerans]
MKANERLLEMFIHLTKNHELTKKELTDMYGVSSSSIQRDIQALKLVLGQFIDCEDKEIILQPSKGVYRLNRDLLAKIGLGNLSLLEDHKLLAILKVIISSRAFTEKELGDLLEVLTPDDFVYKNLLKNEVTFYKGVPSQSIFDKLELILRAISEQRMISFSYTKYFKTVQFTKMVEMIFFSDMYFYIATANHTSEDDIHVEKLNKFRINNMEHIKLLDKGKTAPYHQRFQPIDLTHRTGSFAFFGKPIEVMIDFYYDPIYVLDRFPNHRIVSQRTENGETVTRLLLETNDGYGLKMWLLMQGKQVKVIRPQYLKKAIQEELHQVLKLYDD